MSNFAAFFQEHRIGSTDKLSEKLVELGATEVSDLLDLEDEDMMTLQPPIMKKLEFVRFRRAIELLKLSKIDHENVMTPPNIYAAQSAIADTSTKHLKEDTSSFYEYPPLPPSCPGKGCTGTLSVALGKRINKQLMKLNGPDFRWIVSCSDCTTRWHSCHFLCGHISKISPIGSSDISRHELGRFNRWQSKIKRPCANNPDNQILKAGYNEEWRKHQSNKVTDVPREIYGTMEINVTPADLIQQVFDEETTNEETLITMAASSFDIDEAVFSELPVCTSIGNGGKLTSPNDCDEVIEKGSTAKRVKLADGSYSQDKAKPDCLIDKMCCEIRQMMICDKFGTDEMSNTPNI